MPELPEVECLRRSLEPHLLGRRVDRATLRRRDTCTPFKGKATAASLLEGSTITQLLRRGKQLAIVSNTGAVLVVHLGMSGQLLFAPSAVRGPGAPQEELPTHTHATWDLTLDNHPAGRLLFRDPRRFGGIWTFPSLDTLINRRWALLGPDALTITTEQLTQATAGSHRAIKAALLDQASLAGIGNIYADEALYLAGIRPGRTAAGLKPPELAALASAIRETLSRSIATGGSTLRDYRDANGQAGSSQLDHAVYGRAGERCLTCSGTLKSARMRNARASGVPPASTDYL